MSPAEAVALMLGPALLTNIWQGFAGSGTAAILRRLWPTLIGLCVGTWVASMIGFGLTPEAANRARVTLGITLAAYAGIGLADIRFTLRAEAEQWLGPLVGLATGVLSAATGVFMIPAVPYYQAIGYSNEELVRVQGISYTVSTLALVALLSSNGVLQTANASMSALAVVPALAGMALGQRVRRLVSPRRFGSASISACWRSARISR